MMIQLHRRLVLVCVRSQKFLMEVLNRGMGDDFIKPEHSGVEGQEKQTNKQKKKKKEKRAQKNQQKPDK